MQYVLQNLTRWAALLGPIATIVGLIQSRGWLTAIGVVCVCFSIAAFVYARMQRGRVDAALVEIEGISIDSVSAANLRRRVNRSLFVQTADHAAIIDGPNLEMIWRYVGYCRADRETAMEFSVDSGNTLPFDSLDCFAYDLKSDPDKQHRIRPLLIGPDGMSKKLAVPFSEPLLRQQPFDIMLDCRLPDTYKTGIGHYTSSLSFNQDTVGRCTVRLTFRHPKPEWVRVYDCDASGRPRLVRNLSPDRQDDTSVEYSDVAENHSARSARIYLFQRGGT